jgi:hypothetical protein
VAIYSTLGEIKARLGIPSTDTGEDALLTELQAEASAYVEAFTGRVFAPLSQTVFVQDGNDALLDGRLMLFPRGIISLSQLEIAPYTGGAFRTIPAGNYFLRPTGPDLMPGWPYTELWMTDIPTPDNPYPRFFRGFDNVRLTGQFGWPATPPDIDDLVATLTVAAWRARGQRGGDEYTVGVDGQRVFERLLSARDRETLLRYRISVPGIA